MSVVSTFQEGKSFWDLNQDFKIVEPFKSLYEKDKSKGKINSSNTMWFITFCYDMESRFYNLAEIEKHEIIGQDYVGNKNFYEENKKTLIPCIEMFCKLLDTSAKRALRGWNQKMSERDEFIRKTPYNLDTADQLDKMMGNTKKLYDDYQRVIKDLNQSEDNGTSKGDKELSLTDRGAI